MSVLAATVYGNFQPLNNVVGRISWLALSTTIPGQLKMSASGPYVHPLLVLARDPPISGDIVTVSNNEEKVPQLHLILSAIYVTKLENLLAALIHLNILCNFLNEFGHYYFVTFELLKIVFVKMLHSLEFFDQYVEENSTLTNELRSALDLLIYLPINEEWPYDQTGHEMNNAYNLIRRFYVEHIYPAPAFACDPSLQSESESMIYYTGIRRNAESLTEKLESFRQNIVREVDHLRFYVIYLGFPNQD